MANPMTSQPILLLLVAFLSVTQHTHSLCSDSIITSLSLTGFTHFAHALHSHNLSATPTAARPTCFVVPDSVLLGRPVTPNTVEAHILPSLALPLQSLLRLLPNTVLPTLRRNTTLVSGTDGRRVSLNNVLIIAPNLHVDDSCIVHGVEVPLIDDDDDETKTSVTPPRRRFEEVVRFIRRAHRPVHELQREVKKTEVMDNQLSLYDAAAPPGSDEYLSSDGSWNPCLFFSPNYSQEEFLQGFLSSSCGMEEADYWSSHWNEDEVEETYAGEEHLPYYGCGNWLSEYGHSFCDSWGDGYLSLENGIQKNEEGSELKKVEEDSRQCEQQYECNYGQGVAQEGYPTFDSSTWSCDSWFAYGGKTDSHGYNEQESRTSHSYYPPEIGVFESVFGYWPCLYRY